jgi:dihydrolipoamide dehydrogenase-binding protein of pyruvate dehydrogenase complex
LYLFCQQKPEGSTDVKVGTLIAMMVAEGEDWKDVQIPAAIGAPTPQPRAATPAPKAAAPAPQTVAPPASSPVPSRAPAPTLAQQVWKVVEDLWVLLTCLGSSMSAYTEIICPCTTRQAHY